MTAHSKNAVDYTASTAVAHRFREACQPDDGAVQSIVIRRHSSTPDRLVAK